MGFLSGVLIRIFFRVPSVSPRVFRVSFRIQTVENKAKEKKNKEKTKRQ